MLGVGVVACRRQVGSTVVRVACTCYSNVIGEMREMRKREEKYYNNVYIYIICINTYIIILSP